MFNMNKGAPRGRPAGANEPGTKARKPACGRKGTSKLASAEVQASRLVRNRKQRARLPAEGVAGDGAVGDESVLQDLKQGLGFGRAIDSVAAEAVLGGDDARVFQAQERLVGG